MMELPASAKQNDSVLLPLLKISKQELSPAINEILVVHAEPIIHEILRNRMDRSSKLEQSAKDIEDIHAEIILRLLTLLNSFRIHPEEKGIQDFAKYVAVVTHNACNEYYREKYPERSRLKKRLRYLLGHDPMFAIWESIDS